MFCDQSVVQGYLAQWLDVSDKDEILHPIRQLVLSC